MNKPFPRIFTMDSLPSEVTEMEISSTHPTVPLIKQKPLVALILIPSPVTNQDQDRKDF